MKKFSIGAANLWDFYYDPTGIERICDEMHACACPCDAC